MQRAFFLFFLFTLIQDSAAQTIGGNNVYNFLKLPNAPQLTALGGINVSNQSSDIGLVYNNPALLRNEMHTQLSLVFNAMYGGIKNYYFQFAYHHQKVKTNFSIGINYFNYGLLVETDQSGNVFGDLKPRDYVVQVSANRMYAAKWHYGASLKFIYSQYAQYRSSGIALDAGLSFSDTVELIQAGLVLKNMGAQIKAYNGTDSDDLPFDVQLGISKRLQKAPIQFSVSAHHLHQFNIKYDDTLFNNENGTGNNPIPKKFTFDKLFRHFILATQLYIDDKVEVSVGYNYLRRKELNFNQTGNGLNGFSVGVGVLLRNFQLRYARSYYQNNTAYNQFGLNLTLGEYLNFKSFDRINR